MFLSGFNVLWFEAFSIQMKKEKKDGYKSSQKVAKISAIYLSMQMSNWIRWWDYRWFFSPTQIFFKNAFY